ncbi:hypothetical protein KKF84_03080 [Myxococcota bacterium]|nr:hypothetical protein [Myxococcota bacterium]
MTLRTGGLFFSYSGKAPANPGATVELSFLVYDTLSMFAGYSWMSPVEVEGNRADITLSRHPGHLGVAWNKRWGSFSFSLAFMAVLDFVSVSTRINSIFISAIPPKAHQTFSVLPMATLSWHVASRVSVYAGVGLEFFINNRYYVVEGHDTMGEYASETIIDPWMVQPRFQIGLEIKLF